MTQSIRDLRQIQIIQKSLQRPCSVPSSLRAVQENTTSTGSDMNLENLLQESFTLRNAGTLSVRGDLMGTLPHTNVSTTCPRRTSVTMMLGFITALWPHVERYCLEKEEKLIHQGQVSTEFATENLNLMVLLYHLISFKKKFFFTSADTPWSTIALVLAASNCLSVIVIIILGSQLYKHRGKGRNYCITLL